VFLFDKSLTKYSGPLTARPLPDSVNFIGEPSGLIYLMLLLLLLLLFFGY